MTNKHKQSNHNDFENLVSTLSLLTIVVITSFISNLMNSSLLVPAELPLRTARMQVSESAPTSGSSHELQIRFEQGVALLHAKQYEYAVTAMERVIALAPKLPEAYVNLGFALLGLNHFEQAGESFNRATLLKVDQTNAYWGLALAMEGLKDYEGALGAMRAYIHLSTPEDPFLPRARAALWEWEAQLGRIPGTKTVPDEPVKSNSG